MATERVGVRELRQNLSRYLRRVERGERLEVTERGKPVAVLGPVDESGSALVKLVVPEPETKALRDSLRSWPERLSSVVALIEVERVARRIGGGAMRRARTVMSRIALMELDEEVVRTAASLDPPTLRTLDP